MGDTIAVEIRLIEIEHVRIGLVRAYAAVAIEIAGIEFIVQGIAVVEAKREIRVDLPSFQRDGRRFPAFCLPDELFEPIGRLVLDAYREPAAGSRVRTPRR